MVSWFYVVCFRIILFSKEFNLNKINCFFVKLILFTFLPFATCWFHCYCSFMNKSFAEQKFFFFKSFFILKKKDLVLAFNNVNSNDSAPYSRCLLNLFYLCPFTILIVFLPGHTFQSWSLLCSILFIIIAFLNKDEEMPFVFRFFLRYVSKDLLFEVSGIIQFYIFI